MTQRHHLKLLTYNIQVGIETSHYGHYFTRAWRYALPFRSRHENLNRIAQMLRPYDLVALQDAEISKGVQSTARHSSGAPACLVTSKRWTW